MVQAWPDHTSCVSAVQAQRRDETIAWWCWSVQPSSSSHLLQMILLFSFAPWLHLRRYWRHQKNGSLFALEYLANSLESTITVQWDFRKLQAHCKQTKKHYATWAGNLPLVSDIGVAQIFRIQYTSATCSLQRWSMNGAVCLNWVRFSSHWRINHATVNHAHRVFLPRWKESRC